MVKPLQQTCIPRWSAMARLLKSYSGKTALAGAFVAAAWLSPEVLKAQTIKNNYDFAASNGTYTPLGATATQMSAVKADSYISGSTPIGFTFNFDGVDYTEFKVSSNGFISFNTTATSSETANNLASSTSRPIIAPLWDDLDGNATGGISNAAYEVTGTAGSRVFTFEWRNWEWRYDSNNPVVSFQVKLYEGSNKIEFVYQPESGSVVTGSASVGLAGLGANNFMSLNNLLATATASTTTEVTNINTKPAAGQIFTFTRPAASAIDVMATGLASPLTVACYGPNQLVQVTIKNNGTAPLNFAATPVTVNASVTGMGAITFPPVVLNTGTLAPGATQNVTVANNYNMNAVGTYTFNASATVAGDGRTLNDAIAPVSITTNGRQVNSAATLPQTLDFTGFTGSNLSTVNSAWAEASGTPVPSGTTSSWTSKTGLGGTNNVTAKINLWSTGKNEWLMGPKVVPTASTLLRFKAAITNYDVFTPVTNGMQTDDKVQVMVSTDCGATFTPIYTMDPSSNLTNTLTEKTVSLAAYAGQNIVVAFFATEGATSGSQDYDFHIDDIFIGTPPSADLGVTAFVTPATVGCYPASQSVQVTIQNFGVAPIDFAATNATVSVRTHGAAAGVISVPVNTGTLAPGATQNVTVGNVNMAAAGTYNFRAYTTLTADNNAANDTARTASTVLPVVSLPQNVDFTGYTGSNLTTVFPNWREASGATTPAGTSSGWVSKTGLGSASNVTAKINLYSNSAREWIVGPKVTATLNTVLKFKAAVTDYDAVTPDASGMTGTDDKVQVMVSTDCGATFTPIYTMDATSNLTNVLTDQSVSFANYVGQQIMVAFFATEGTVNDAPDYDFHLDDIKLMEIPPVDLEVVKVIMPSNTCGMSTSETICMTIRNNGSTAATNFPVSYTVNTGTAVNEVAAITLAPGATTQYCFTTKANFSTPATYNVVANVNASGDADPTNNIATGTTVSKQLIATFPYSEGFETNAGGWVAGGTSSSWALGTPAGNTINSAAAGTKSWKTNLTGTYPNNENSTVTGPCFNFTNVPNPTISMKVWWDTEFSWDGAVLQSSIDNGTTWQNVGAMGDPNHWYNDNTIGANPGGQQIGWTGTGSSGSGGWVTASHALTGLGGQAAVQLRIAFASDGSTVGDGFAFDEVSVSNAVAVPTITAGGPLIFCTGGSVVLTAATTTPGATFQWYNSGTAIAGATSATYTATIAGNYSVTATAGGSATSQSLDVVVNPAAATPTITAGGSTTLCNGSSVTLTAASTTSGATYQWFNNGTAINGATAAAYTANAAGSYTVVATANGCPSAASAATAVTVNAATATPTVTAGGATTICAGSSVTLTAASATTGATYQWSNNGAAISGGTNGTLTATAAGTYTVIATANGCPSGISLPTVITVTALPATPTITQNGGNLTSSSATGNQWYLNGVAIPGATAQTYVTTANGNYTVVVTANGCASATSAVKNVTNTGIADALAGMSVDVYPNPATGSFNVKLNGYQKDATVVLYNLAGQQITKVTATADGKAQNINLKGLAAGTYLLKVTSDKGVQVSRLIVQ